MFSWIFPHYCVLCDKRSDGPLALCTTCMAGLPRVPRPLCLYCGYPVRGDQVVADRCVDCEGKTRPFLFARSVLLRDEVTLALIHRLKFCGDVFLSRVGGLLLAQLWDRHPELSEFDDWCLVPVPVSRARLAKRRYNQAEELARFLAKERGGMPIAFPLKRLPSSIRSQARLSANQRRLHARSVFRLKDAYARAKKSLPPHILLVDDVYTTGATSRACARLIKKIPGVQCVAVITLLRVPKRHIKSRAARSG